MKITVINGTEKHGVTYRMKEIFLEPFRNNADITEYYLPGDGPGFCTGCTACFMKDQNLCRGNVRKAGSDHHSVPRSRWKIHGKGYKGQPFMVGHFDYQSHKFQADVRN